MTAPSPTKPQRKDAARNREAILRAAGESFAVRGCNVDVREIARAAGVGMGTLYRHFATKDQLLAAVLKADFDAWMATATQAASGGDPWANLEGFLHDALTRQVADRAMLDGIWRVLATTSVLDELRAQFAAVIELLVGRAQAAGAMRPDASAADIAMTMMSLGRIVELTEDARPGLWRRQLRIALDGLRADGHTPITEPPITVAELDAAVCTPHPPMETR